MHARAGMAWSAIAASAYRAYAASTSTTVVITSRSWDRGSGLRKGGRNHAAPQRTARHRAPWRGG
jgi:hypothetical protein